MLVELQGCKFVGGLVRNPSASSSDPFNPNLSHFAPSHGFEPARSAPCTCDILGFLVESGGERSTMYLHRPPILRAQASKRHQRTTLGFGGKIHHDLRLPQPLRLMSRENRTPSPRVVCLDSWDCQVVPKSPGATSPANLGGQRGPATHVRDL